jgi:hypothetical protein
LTRTTREDSLLALLERHSALAHPANSARRNTDKEAIIWNIALNYGSRTDEGVSSDSNAAYYGGVSSYCRAAFYERLSKFTFAFDESSRGIDIRKHARGAAKHLIFKHYSSVKRHVILDLTAAAHAHTRTNHAVLPNDTTLPNVSSRQDVAEVPDLCAGTDAASVIDIGAFMDKA